MSMSHDELRGKVAAALNIQPYHIDEMYNDAAIHRLPLPGGKEYEDTGKLYKTPFSVLDGEIQIFPDKRQEVTPRKAYDPVVKMSVEFSAGDAVGDVVPYIGKVFTCGDYPDKEFSLTEAEADAAIAAFSPVQNDYEHTAGPLAGKWGNVTRLWREGADLFAESAIPAWARQQLGDKVQASLAWARDTKRVIGNALTSNPRVTDAQLIAAFAKAATLPQKETSTMNLVDKLKALFSGGTPTEEAVKAVFTAEVPDPTPAPVIPTPDPVQFAANPALDGLKAKLLANDADAMFANAVKTGKVTPAQRESFLVLFTSLHKGDNAGVVTFSADGAAQHGAGVKALTAFLDALPENPALFTEQLQGQGPLFTVAQDNSKPTAERVNELRAMGGLPAK